jgi:osomolarity two-component system, response regulator SSK1
VVCTFDIAHKFTTYSAPSAGSSDELHLLELDSPPDLIETRPEPQFESKLLRCLLKLIGGTLRTSLEPKSFPKGRRCELSVTLERGPPLAVLDQRTPPAEDDMYRQPPSDIRLAREPSIDELSSFAETLRGKRVAFHASSQGSFAHHLTRYLTAWGMDILHVPTDGLEETDPAEGTRNVHMPSEFGNLASSPGVGIFDSENVPPIVDSSSDAASDHKPASSEMGLSLIIIDDDVQGLRRRLLQHRAETMPNLQLHPRKRPSLAAHHRPRSSPSVRNSLLSIGAQQQPSPLSAFSLVPIVHFTSLANYKLVKDAIQAMILGIESLPLIPEVIVIPKPAGPRRILTALHTAIHKPLVDPFFSPIATSPMSPCGTVLPLITGRKSTGASNPPSGLRSGSERFARAGSDSATPIPPLSSHSIPQGFEYFSDAAVKTLGGNAASGLVIQSPDGRPAGIFFQPQSRVPSSRGELTMTTMERERTTLRPVNQRVSRRQSSRKPGADSTADMADTSREATSRYRSSSKTSLTLSPTRLSFSSTASPCPDRPRLDDQTDLLKSYQGKGRVRTDGMDQEDSRVLSSAAWKEVTQKLAKQPGTPLAPLESNLESEVTISVTHSAMANSTSTVQMPSNSGLPAPISRSSASCTTPDPKKFATRRTTQGPTSPVVSTNLKKSKTVGNNIVPPISVLIVEGMRRLLD